MDLAGYRKSQGLSQKECARELHFSSKGTISALETGAYKTSVKTALRIYKWSKGNVDPKTLVRPEEVHLLLDLAGLERV